MQPTKIAFFTNNLLTTATEHLRVLGPISYTDIEILIGLQNKNNLHNIIEEAQLILFQRDFPKNYSFYCQVVEIARMLNKPIVYDIDDNLLALPENHPDRSSFAYSEALIPMLEAVLNADYVTVSNEFLKQKLSNLHQNIFVLPNYLDETIWSFHLPVKQKETKALTLGYMGGNTHKSDIELITPVLFELKNQLPDKLRFHFYGVKPPDKLLSFPDTIWTPIKTHNYKEFAKDFQQIEVDFSIAPLIRNEFNKCKSAIKFFEYSTLGVPGIFSRINPYSEHIVDGENGFLAESVEEWDRKIRILINNHDLRYQMAENAQNTIKEKYLMSKNSYRWVNAYHQIIKSGSLEHSQKNDLEFFVKGISEQIHEYHNFLSSNLYKAQKRFDDSKNEISNLNNQISSLKNEVLYYACSKSWQITRPIRKFMQLIKGKERGH